MPRAPEPAEARDGEGSGKAAVERGAPLSPAVQYSARYRRYVLGLLLVVFTFSIADRQILAVLLESIKRDLGLSDSQLGFLSGVAFALFYATLGVPIATWADRGSRRTIIAAALTVWSGMTAVCGLARGFWELLTARVLVGAGEAGCNPSAHSLIADFFRPERRGTAMSIFALGVPAGVFVGFLAGGWVNQLYGWRAAFLALGVPGVLLALLVRATLREPPRGHAEGRAFGGSTPPLRETARYLWSRRSYRNLGLAAALHVLVGYGVGQWFPAFMERSHGLNSAQIGTALAFIIGPAGAVGTFLGGWLADRWQARDERWYVWVPGLSTLIAVPFSVGIYLVETPTAAFGLMIFSSVLGSMYLGPSYALAQSLAQLRMRAVSSAILLFVGNIIGLGLGPQSVGILSDLLRPSLGDESLRWALLSMVFVNLWSALHYGLAGRTLREDLDAARHAPTTAVGPPPAAPSAAPAVHPR